jgi:hypothetical protein
MRCFRVTPGPAGQYPDEMESLTWTLDEELTWSYLIEHCGSDFRSHEDCSGSGIRQVQEVSKDTALLEVIVRALALKELRHCYGST